MQDLCLNGHVQRGGGFVGNEDLGLAGQGHGDHDTLAHTAGKLVRILKQNRLGIGDLHGVEHLQRLLLRFLLIQLLMNNEGLAELPLDGKHRVQAGHGLLEDNGDLVAADGIHFLLGKLGQILAFEEDLPLSDIAIAIQQLEDAHGRY